MERRNATQQLLAEDITHSGSWDVDREYVVYAPSGKLGIVLDNNTFEDAKQQGGPVICIIKENSPLVDRMDAGDRLVGVDEVDVRAMTPTQISRLISQRSRNPVRKLTLVRHAAVVAAAVAAANQKARTEDTPPTARTIRRLSEASRDPPELTLCTL